MHRIPQRNTLAAQAAIILREEIQSGAWIRHLPGEHELCEQLNISRVTLRAALEQLQREGLLKKPAPGRRREIVAPRYATPTTTERVVLLTPHPLHSMSRFVLYWIDNLRQHIAEAGHHLDVHCSLDCYKRSPGPALEALAARLRPVGWILYSSTAAMQEWFSDRALPCVITGSRHPQVLLPAVDIDYRAVTRHAVGILLARKHRHIVFLNLDSGLAGDLESEEGFLDGLHKTGERAEGSVVHHDGTVPAICAKLAHCLTRSSRPTAFLVARPLHALTVVSYLMSRGIRVPADAAVISRDDDQYLDHLVPSVAHYACSPTLLAKRISSIVLEMMRTGMVKPNQNLLMPEFVRGQTVG